MKWFSPLRIQNIASLLFILLLAAFPASTLADQVNVPLADSATQKSAQNQSVDQADKPAAPVIAENEMYDIREPIPIPDSNRLFWLIATVLVALFLIGLILYFWKKRTCEQKAVLAHETALRELERAGPLIEEQNINAFITLIDQTLRRYIEQRFNIFARRQTTREFIHGLAEDREDVPEPLTENFENLKTWLQHCDLVKFAKAGLSRETMTDMVSNIRLFIESTKLEAEEK